MVQTTICRERRPPGGRESQRPDPTSRPLAGCREAGLTAVQDGVGNEAGRFVEGDPVGVDYQVVEQGVIDVAVEMLLEVTLAPAVLLLDEMQRRLALELVELLQALDRLLSEPTSRT